MKFSSFLSLNLHDLVKGAIMAGLGAAYAIVEPLLSTGNLTVDWLSVGKISLGTAIVYLLKNFLTSPPAVIVVDPDKTKVDKIQTSK